MPRRFVEHVGNRGIVLAVLGVLWLLTALGIAQSPVVPRTLPPDQQPVLPHEQMPVWFRVLLWAVPGVLALVAVVWRRLDPLAWALLIAPALVRFASYAFAWVFGTYPAGWRGATVYAVVVVLINRCAAGLDRPAPWDGRERRWTAGTGPT